MFDRFRWTVVSRRRNIAMAEYEPIQPYVLLALAEQAGCGTFLDIGSNIGAYSLFASLVPSIDQIVAFEANPDAAREIRANIALNGLSAIDVREEAVSSKCGELRFGIVSRFAGNNGAVTTSETDFAGQIAVPCVTLDSVFPDPFSRAVCVKIDVEGHEAEVLAGAARFLASNRCVIQIEDYKERVKPPLLKAGYSALTTIGPDRYFSNIPGLSAIAAYELASRRIIEERHRLKALSFKVGDFGINVSGQSANVVRGIAKKAFGSRL